MSKSFFNKLKAKRKSVSDPEPSGPSGGSAMESIAIEHALDNSTVDYIQCDNMEVEKKEADETCFVSLVPDSESNDSDEENDRFATTVDFGNIEEKVRTPKLVSPADGNLHSTIPKQVQPTDGESSVNKPNPLSQLPCDIFFINNKHVLQKVETFNELSEYLVNSAAQVKDNSGIHILQKLIKIPVHNSEHYVTLGQYLRHLYEHDLLMDVYIQVKGEVFHAHSIALCCNSDYFAELFAKQINRKIPFEIKIKGISPAGFAAFLEFCYTGEIQATPETAGDILVAAENLKVPALRDQCDVIARSLPVEESLRLIMKSSGNKSSKLHQTVLMNILKDFKKASVEDNFLDMDIEMFCIIIGSDELEVATEFDVFTVAVRWIVHRLEERVKHTIRVMSHIRFFYMTQLELMMCAETTSLVRGYDKFREMILIACWQITAEQLNRDDPFKFPRPDPRLCYREKCGNVEKSGLMMPTPLMTSTPMKRCISPVLSNGRLGPETHFDILVVGGFVGNDKFIEKYDIQENQWLHFSKLPEPRRHHAVVTVGSSLYLIGGSEPYADKQLPVATNTVHVMDLNTKKWSKLPNMNVYRYSHCACAVNGKIFVVGGKGKYESILMSVECYNPQTKGWAFVPSLPEPLFAAGVASIQDQIYVAGGIGCEKDVPSSLHVLCSVYCFNTTTSSWSTLNELRIPRCHTSLVNVNDSLFLCGGATGAIDHRVSVLHSTAAIDLYHVTEDAWEHVAEMMIPRHNVGVAVAGERIYMIGGISTTADRALQSVECYDTRTTQWASGIQDLPYPARWIVGCTIPSKTLHPGSLE